MLNCKSILYFMHLLYIFWYWRVYGESWQLQPMKMWKIHECIEKSAGRGLFLLYCGCYYKRGLHFLKDHKKNQYNIICLLKSCKLYYGSLAHTREGREVLTIFSSSYLLSIQINALNRSNYLCCPQVYTQTYSIYTFEMKTDFLHLS